ncbi:hypothetical protein [Thalassococcus profundi]|uniref:hypothetical protein n=1 Tax=Thalassococcus profundi TaxID=2282382 RepID=UPI004057CD17
MTDPDYHLIDRCYDSPFAEETLARFLHDHGVRMTAAALPPGVGYGAPRQCFRNAWDLTLNSRMEYWEGYGWDPQCAHLPFHHAWCVDRRSGFVCDPTWRDAPDAVYLGVHVPRRTLMSNLHATGMFGILDKGCGFEHATVKEYWGWISSNPTPPAARAGAETRIGASTSPS